uniref:Uncharacterized protein n=1 Tax=Anguilla anguilla TaxID=7936 RepID=A0A0E9VDG3_ANGAN
MQCVHDHSLLKAKSVVSWIICCSIGI